MKEMIIKIPEDTTELLTELVEELGGTVKPEEKKSKSSLKNKKKKEKKSDPTFLFGKWKDFDVDARKIGEELWTRKF
jgi:hypothetical protein